MGVEETVADVHLAHESRSPSRRAEWGLEVPAQLATFTLKTNGYSASADFEVARLSRTRSPPSLLGGSSDGSVERTVTESFAPPSKLEWHEVKRDARMPPSLSRRRLTFSLENDAQISSLPPPPEAAGEGRAFE